MKRLERIKEDIFKLYDTIENDMNRLLCRNHHLHVYHEMEKLSNDECLYIAALLHDIGTYLGFRGKHALTSAKFAKEFLEKYDCFSTEELDLIYEVIALHSNKDQVDFYEAELLKQADMKAHHLEDFF